METEAFWPTRMGANGVFFLYDPVVIVSNIPIGLRLKKENDREILREVPTLPPEHAESVHMSADKGNSAGLTPSPTRRSRSGRPSETHNWLTHNTLVVHPPL